MDRRRLRGGQRAPTIRCWLPEPQDLYLAAILSLDPDTGEILADDVGSPQVLDSGLLLRWEEIEYLEFTEAAAEEDNA